MEARDFRGLGREAQEALRRRALFLVEQEGMTQGQAALAVGVHRQTVNVWPEFAVGGERAGIRACYQEVTWHPDLACAHKVGRCRVAQPTARIVLGAEMSSFLKISVSSGAILVA